MEYGQSPSGTDRRCVVTEAAAETAAIVARKGDQDSFHLDCSLAQLLHDWPTNSGSQERGSWLQAEQKVRHKMQF